MIETTPITTPVVNSITRISTSNFQIPRKVFNDGRLRTLSGDALRMFIFLSHELYGRQTREVNISNCQIVSYLGLDRCVIRDARSELESSRLIDCKQTTFGYLYRFPDEGRTPQTKFVVK